MTPRCFRYRGHPAPILVWMLLITIVSVQTMGCGTDEEPAGTLTEDQIQQSLDEAQTSLQSVGVAVSFEDTQLLADTEHFASPLELSQLEDVAAIESAIRALNEALDIASTDQTGVAAAPTMDANETRLKPLIHLNLAYLYMLSAVSRCMVHGGDIYTIKAQDDPQTPAIEFYSLALKSAGLERRKGREFLHLP